jgi:hypothetical protein
MESRLCSIIAAVCLSVAAILVPSCLWARQHEEDPAELAAKIQHQTNPIKKVRLEIRLARLDLREASRAYGQNRARKGQRFLTAYLHEITGSWQLLESTGHNAAKKPQGFMELEIALRENARTLNNLEDRVYYMYQGSIETAEKEVNQLHSKVMLALFPGAAPPQAGTKAPKAAGSFTGKELPL